MSEDTQPRPQTGRTASVGVDVDSLWHYFRIYGLPEDRTSNAAWRDGVSRFVELFAELGIPATFYCVASDLEIPGNTERLQALVAAGHEIGNHTLNHRYDLTRMAPEERVVEVGQGRYRLEMAANAPVTGFRAPGYNTDAGLSADVRQTGHTYDSSVFPCVPYYTAKASVMGLMRLRGRESRSILGTPKVLLAPREPYRMAKGEPHARVSMGASDNEAGLAQFPVSVAAGVPMLGGAFTTLGGLGAELAAKAAVRMRQHLTIEFHALDLLSLREDNLNPALAAQPDLRVPLAQKRAIFERVLKAVGERAQFVRLCDLKLD